MEYSDYRNSCILSTVRYIRKHVYSINILNLTFLYTGNSPKKCKKKTLPNFQTVGDLSGHYPTTSRVMTHQHPWLVFQRLSHQLLIACKPNTSQRYWQIFHPYLGIMEDNWGTHLKPLRYHITVMFEGFQGALNWFPMMPASQTAVRLIAIVVPFLWTAVNSTDLLPVMDTH